MEEVHRFIADSIAQGLVTVRDELGADAIILSVDENPGAVQGMGKVQILAKSSGGGNVAVPVAEGPPKSPFEKDDSEASGGKTDNGLGESASSDPGGVKNLLAQLYSGQSEENPPAGKVDVAQKSTDDSQVAAKEKSRLGRKAHKASMLRARAEERMSRSLYNPITGDDIQSVKKTFQRPDPYQIDLPPEASSLYFYLIETGIEPDIAEELIDRLCRKMQPLRGWNRNRVRSFLSSLVSTQIRTGGILGQTKKKRVVAMIGPTGVGKTTTIAKLATQLTRSGVSVGLISIDHFRVGAVHQLRKFAETMNVPLLAASSKAELLKALRGFNSKKMVLIDTAGQNPRDLELLDRLNQTLNVAGQVERHLVLAAPTKERDIAASVELYNTIGFDYLLFSKLDETATYGSMLNSYFAADRPFSYFTTGQKVPEDIEAASSSRLNELLFN